MQKIYLFVCMLFVFKSNAQKVLLPTFESFRPLEFKSPKNNFLEQYSIRQQQKILLKESQNRAEQLARFRKIQEKGKHLIGLRENSLINQKKYYCTAAQDLEKLLQSKTKISTKKAVFCVEKAFFQNDLLPSKVDSQINSIVHFLKTYTIYQDWDWNDYDTRQKVLMMLFTDTLFLSNEVMYPFSYAHKDPYGLVNYPNVFVSKLLSTKTGQCHSLPLLYKILAEEIGVEAYLCLMPQHSYIRIVDNQGKWYNFETTCGKIVSTAWLVASGFVSSEAIASRIYMDTLDNKAIITNAIADLLEGYIRKFGYDDFVLKWSDVALHYNPKAIRCLLWKSNYLTIRSKYLIKEANYPPKNKLSNYPIIWDNYQKMVKTYEQVDDLGHKIVPNAVYQKWLNTAQQ